LNLNGNQLINLLLLNRSSSPLGTPSCLLPLLWRGRIKVGVLLPLLWRGRIKVGVLLPLLGRGRIQEGEGKD